MADADLELLNSFQRDFPLISQPFQAMAEPLRWSEAEVLTTLRRLTVEGKISRVGAVFATRRLGVSTLAALAVPPARLEAVAEGINDYPEVNHNYQREHHFNLWFVLTAATGSRLQAVLADIEVKTGLPILNLPLLEEFHIDLGFDLRTGESAMRHAPGLASSGAAFIPIDAADQDFLAALQPGLPLVSRPFHSLGQPLGWPEQRVIKRLRDWLEQGVIRRMGIIVRHRALGYQANAMVVWDVPDAEVSRVGRMLAAESGVNLCYRRPRRLPHWPYNLFCMMHGRQQADTLERVDQLRQARSLTDYPYAVLFSTRCFRQRGAYYLPAAASSETGSFYKPLADVGQLAWTS